MNESAPANKFHLKFTNLAPGVIRDLQVLRRTGWVRRNVANPESVQEHTIAARRLVISEKDSLQFTPEGLEEILDILEIHDWPEHEPKVGDQVILSTTENKEVLKKEKYKAELDEMIKICKKLGKNGERILELWLRYENGQDPVSSFARQVDKLQAMEKAFEYEREGEQVSTQEFISEKEKEITHPVLIRRLKELKVKLAGFQSNE